MYLSELYLFLSLGDDFTDILATAKIIVCRKARIF